MKSAALVTCSLRIARDYLDGAVVLTERNDPNAVYLCHQAAWHILRALFQSRDEVLRVGCELWEMVELTARWDPLAPLLLELETLCKYADCSLDLDRWNESIEAPDVDTLARLIQRTEIVLTEVAARLGVDLTDKSPPTVVLS